MYSYSEVNKCVYENYPAAPRLEVVADAGPPADLAQRLEVVADAGLPADLSHGLEVSPDGGPPADLPPSASRWWPILACLPIWPMAWGCWPRWAGAGACL
jgi:hypothetical protein